MGLSHVFWVNEGVIKQLLKEEYPYFIEKALWGKSNIPATDSYKTEDIEKLLIPIGRTIIDLSEERFGKEYSLPFYNKDNVFNYSGTYHSTEEALFIWTGDKLKHLNTDIYKNKDLISKLESYSDDNCFAFPLSWEEFDNVNTNQVKWDNVYSYSGDYGIYWIYNDYVERHKKEYDYLVGEQFLNLVLSNYQQSKDIADHQGAINKVCSVIKPQIGFFIWSGNCLSKLSRFEKNSF